MKKKTLINISKKTFIQVSILLFSLLLVSIAMTYFVQKGDFGTLADGQTDYLEYIPRTDKGGIKFIHDNPILALCRLREGICNGQEK